MLKTNETECMARLRGVLTRADSPFVNNVSKAKDRTKDKENYDVMCALRVYNIVKQRYRCFESYII